MTLFFVHIKVKLFYNIYYSITIWFEEKFCNFFWKRKYFDFSIINSFFLANVKFLNHKFIFLMYISETINKNSFNSINDSQIDLENMNHGVLIFDTDLPDQNEIALAFSIDEENIATTTNED